MLSIDGPWGTFDDLEEDFYFLRPGIVDMESPRRRFLAFATSTGTLGVAGCLTLFRNDTPGDDATGAQETDTRPLTLSKSGPSDLAESSEVYSGWVHVVAHGETYDLTFDVRLCHERGEEVAVNLHGLSGGDYDLDFDTTGSTETRKTPTDSNAVSHCGFGTRITGSGTLPQDFQSLRVTANGRTLQTLENEGTMPVMRPLPDPIDARDE